MIRDRSGLTRRSFGQIGLAAGSTALMSPLLQGGRAAAAPSGEPIKVGILHSLSGTMAISETTLKDVMLMLIAEQNAKGGLLGRPLVPVVVDPASNWPLFAEKARQLLKRRQGIGGVRLLDQRVAQIRAAGIRGAERDIVVTRCSTKARNAAATSSIPGPRLISRQSPRSTT